MARRTLAASLLNKPSADAAALLAVVLTFGLASPPSTATANHSRSSSSGTHTTPVATDPYSGGEEPQGAVEGEAAGTATAPGATPPAAEAAGRPAASTGNAAPASTVVKSKVKHAARRESKAPHRTPEVPAAASGAGSSGSSVNGSAGTSGDSSQGSQPAAQQSVPTPAPAAVPAPAPALASAPAAPPAPASAAGPGAKARVHAHRSRPRSRRSSAGRASSTPAASRAPVVPAPVVLAAASSGSGAGARADRESRRTSHAPASASQGGELPIVRSVTRIINVVPLLVRIALAALAALALALAVTSRVAAVRARRLARQRSELLDDVGLLQAALLPPLPPRLGPVGTSAAYEPASGPGAGGDFYDVFALGDGQIAVIVGDVSGHGREALPHTTLVRFTLRAYLEAGLSPRAALATAGPVLERQLGGSFVTVVLATYNPRTRKLVFASAGHPPPLVLGSEFATPITACASPPIGAGRATGTRQTTVTIPGGAIACFYTDGVVEARTAGRLFGARRLQELLAQLPADATAEDVLERVAEATDRRPDDMAACLIRVEGEAAAPGVLVEEVELDGREVDRDRAARFLLAAGVDPAEIEHVIEQLRPEIARHGRVVLELHIGEGGPEIFLTPQNIAALEPSIRAANAQGAHR